MKALIKDVRGVSIILATIYMLVMLILGSIIVTYAVANYSSAINSREGKQEYLSISSALVLIRDQLDGGVIEGTEDTTFKVTFLENRSDLLSEVLQNNLNAGSGDTDFSLEAGSDVEVKAALRQIDLSSRKIIIEAYLENDGLHLSLEVPFRNSATGENPDRYTLNGKKGEIRRLS